MSIHHQEPYTKLEMILESTWPHHTNQHANTAHSRLNSPKSSGLHLHHRWFPYSKTIFEPQLLQVERSPHTDEKDPTGRERLRMRRTKPTEGGGRSLLKEQQDCTIEVQQWRRYFPRTTKCASDMKYSTDEVTYEDEEPCNRITPIAEKHCTARSALLSKYAYKYTKWMLNDHYVKCTNVDTQPCKCEPLHTAKCTYGRDLHTPKDQLRWMRLREDMNWKIWDELGACGSKGIIQNLLPAEL